MSHTKVPRYKTKKMCNIFLNKIHACKVHSIYRLVGDKCSSTKLGGSILAEGGFSIPFQLYTSVNSLAGFSYLNTQCSVVEWNIFKETEHFETATLQALEKSATLLGICKIGGRHILNYLSQEKYNLTIFDIFFVSFIKGTYKNKKDNP